MNRWIPRLAGQPRKPPRMSIQCPLTNKYLQETEPSRTAAMSALAKSWTDYAT